jgi:putative toxin-antitoxin system antitoxin component (TIGR02293 family)
VSIDKAWMLETSHFSIAALANDANDPDQKDHGRQVAEVLTLAARVFESKAEAVAWLRRPAMALDREAPIEVMTTPRGLARVRKLLNQIDYGVYV